MTLRIADVDHAAAPVSTAASVLTGPALSRLGHELRGPLGAIISLTGLMSRKIAARQAVPDDQERQLALLSESASDLLTTVERVIALARWEDTEWQDVDPNAATDCRTIVAQVVAELTGAAQARGHQLLLEVADEPVVVAAPADAVATIVTELVDNAIKYSDRPPIQVAVRRARDRDLPAIVVSDHGPGLTADERDRVFQPFVRGAAAVTQGQPGAGLGLCLAQRAAARYGCGLSVAADGAGTRITVTIGDRPQ